MDDCLRALKRYGQRAVFERDDSTTFFSKAFLLFIACCALFFTAGCQFPNRHSSGVVQVIQTSRSGDRLARKPDLIFFADKGSTNETLRVDPATTYQSIVGFGVAFTESSAYLLSHVSPAIRAQTLHALFSPNGAWFSLCRTHINSLAYFPLGQYNYDDVSNDFELTHFDISPDLKYLVPLIQEAQAVKGADFKLLATPWSPPGWMKANGQMAGGAPLKPDCYAAWALYFSKYIKAYARLGIPINFVTVQNESEYWPEWNGCVYTPQQQKVFVRDFLGPRFERDGIDAKILIYDHNTDHIVKWADAIYSDGRAARYIWGTAFHWYAGDNFSNVATVHNKYPGKHLLFTEGCETGGGHVGEWLPAEHYARSMIGDLNNWTEGWIDWAMTRDEKGGPTPKEITGDAWHCSSQTMIDSKTGQLILNPYYYVFCHFSKYIRPGARRIRITSKPKGLEATAFKNVGGRIVVVIFNGGDNAVSMKLVEGGRKVEYTIPGRALVNFMFQS